MGRELMITTAKIGKDNKIKIAPVNFYTCGRNDFTSNLASPFYNNQADMLILGYDLNETKEVSVYDEEDKKNMELRVVGINPETIRNICSEHKAKSEKMLISTKERFESAKKARDNAPSVSVWQEFTELIEELEDEVNELEYNVAEDALKEIDAIESEISKMDERKDKDGNVLYPVVILSE